MDYKVIVTKDAHDDVDEDLDYIANRLQNPIAAKNLLDKIEEAYNELAFNPYMYQECSNERLQSKGYRKVVVKNYIIIYRVDDEEKTVYVLRMFYGRRDYAKLI